jgi:hypothetical protein
LTGSGTTWEDNHDPYPMKESLPTVEVYVMGFDSETAEFDIYTSGNWWVRHLASLGGTHG